MSGLNIIVKNKFDEYEVRFNTKDKSKFYAVENFCLKILDNESSQNNTEQIYGKWIEDNIILTTNPPQHRWHCNQCGFVKCGFDHSALEPVCPNCGTNMRG